MDITKRLIELKQRYGWTDYKIAKEAGLSPNTVSNIYRRGNTSSMVTLEAICKAFNITMAQFFAEDDMVELTPELRELFDRWTALTDEQKAAIWQIIKPTNNENTNKGFGPYFFDDLRGNITEAFRMERELEETGASAAAEQLTKREARCYYTA